MSPERGCGTRDGHWLGVFLEDGRTVPIGGLIGDRKTFLYKNRVGSLNFRVEKQ
jgi:hypothetical protein